MKLNRFKCEQCKATFFRKRGVRRFCRLSCFHAYNTKENHSRWKDNPNYATSHHWMVRYYGNPKACVGNECSGKSKKFDWALKRGKTASRNPKDYLTLCRSCHMKYDMTDDKRKVFSERAKKRIPQKGEQHGGVKLTENKVDAIRKMYAAGNISQFVLARLFNVGQPAISLIISKTNWKHI